MRWVKDTLPPRARARWLLMTMRLSHSSLTGTVRTLVAVGTVRLLSMFWAVRAAAPRSGTRVGSSLASAGAAGSFSLGTGEDFAAGLAGWLFCSVFFWSGLASAFFGSGLRSGFGSGFGSGLASAFFASGVAAGLLTSVFVADEPLVEPWLVK